jgi:hypothetical protein
MLLRLIKTNRNAGFLMFPFIIVGICIYQLKTSAGLQLPGTENNYILFGVFNALLPPGLILKTIIATLLILIIGFFLFRLYREHLIPNSRTALPVILFIILTFGLPEYGRFHPIWFSAFFMTLGMDRLCASFDLRKPYRNSFEAGFFLGLGSLFYFNLLFFVPAFIAGVRMIIRDVHWREPFLFFLGALVPWLLVFSTYFMLDKTQDLLYEIQSGFLSTHVSILRNIPLLAYLCFLGLLVFAGSFTIIRQFSEKKVRFRKFFTLFFLLFVSSIIILILIPGCSSEILILAAIPFSYFISNYFESQKKTIFGELLFVLIIGFVVFLKFF